MHMRVWDVNLSVTKESSSGLFMSYFMSKPRAQLSYEYLFIVRGQKLGVLIHFSNDVGMKKKLFFQYC